MYTIDKSKKPHELHLFLAKPNKVIISKLKHAYNRILTIKYNESNELSFTLPYEYIKNHKRKPYKPTKQVKEKYLIKAIYGKQISWFVISDYNSVSADIDELNIQAYSLEHQMSKKRIIGFERTSYNCLMVTQDVLKDTGWKVGYINPDFNLEYHSFDVSSDSKLSFLYEIADTFNAILRFDTVKKTVNFYKEDELSEYKGFTITDRNYLEMLESKIDSSEVVTRLYVTGKDGLGIQSINPTGQPYIDDFSYFLYPFEMDEDGNVIKSSYFMEDELSIALFNYNKYVSDRKDDFSSLLENKKKKQEELTEESTDLYRLEEIELKIILDELQVAKNLNMDTSDIVKRRDEKNLEINSQKDKVENINNEIEQIDEDIKQLGEDLALENHFSPPLLEMLYDFIQEGEWSDNNIIDPSDLYEKGIEELSEINAPPIEMTMDIVNFFEVVSEQHNWNRLSVGDIVRILHSRIKVEAKSRVSSIELDFENPTINVNISNLKELNDTKNKLKRVFYTVDRVNTDYNKRKNNWNTAAYNFNIRNDRISEIPASPTIIDSSLTHRENDDGSANLVIKWDYPDWKETEKNEHNIDGFLIYMYADTTDEPYQFGSQMADETMVDVTYNVRTYTFPAVPANLYYTIGVRAYRRVDADINRDGILMSEIVYLNSALAISNRNNARMMTFSAMNTEEQVEDAPTLSEPYQPSKLVNIKNGVLNGSKYTVSSEEPEAPMLNEVWINPIDSKVRVWTGKSWSIDTSANLVDEKVDRTAEELRREIEEVLAGVDEAMEVVDSEMERIENEVVPEVERSVRETFVPKQPYPPKSIPDSGLWWNTSYEPPRMFMWDGIERVWKPVAPTNDEFVDFVGETEETLNEVDRRIVEVNEEVDRIENEVVPRVQAEVDHINDIIVPNINSEMERIENVVIPNVEQTIRDTYVPKSNAPPDPNGGSGLWWDTSQDPPRLNRYNPQTGNWEHVAYTEDEVDSIIDNTRNSIENNVITSINISPEDIEIKSNRVDIHGIVTFINSDENTMTLIDGGKIITGTVTSKQINAGEIFANEAIIGLIQAYSVKTSELSASNIITGTLDASKVSVENLSASNIITGNLDALKVNVLNLSADSIVSGTLDALKVSVANLSASVIKTGELDASLVHIANLNASNITTGEMDGLRIKANSITANQLNVNEIFANDAVIGVIQSGIVKTAELDATKIVSGELDAGKVSIVNLSASKIISGELDASLVNIANLNASNITTGVLKGIEIEGVTFSGGTLKSLNNNTMFNLNTGKLTMANADLEISGGADIHFLDSSNKLYFTRVDTQTSRTRVAGVGVGINFNSRFPFVYLGTSAGSNLAANDSSYFTGYIANTQARMDTDGVGNSVIGSVFHIRDKAISYSKGFRFDLFANEDRARIHPMNSGTYRYDLGSPTGQFDRAYIQDIRSGDGTIRFRNSDNNYASQGFTMELRYDGQPHLYFRGTHTNDYWSLGKPGGWRFSYIYLHYQPDVSSDARLKEDIRHNTLGLDFINDLETKTFKLIDNNKNLSKEPIQYGLIAQQLRDTLIRHGVNVNDINMLSQDENGMYGVQYTQLVAPLIKSVQELSSGQNRITDRITSLENENKLLKEKIRRLEEILQS